MSITKLNVFINNVHLENVANFECNGYDTELLFKYLQECLEYLTQDNRNLNRIQHGITIHMEIYVPDADNNDIPSISIGKELINLIADFRPHFKIILGISSSTQYGTPFGGVSLHILSNQNLNINEINNISGTLPTMFYNAGDTVRQVTKQYSEWILEIRYEDGDIESAISKMIESIHVPSFLGDYCSDSMLNTHIDLTCYSVPNRPVFLNLDPMFFEFCKNLKVDYIDIDIMI